jgi:phosphohistidine phosphatase SixA
MHGREEEQDDAEDDRDRHVEERATDDEGNAGESLERQPITPR